MQPRNQSSRQRVAAAANVKKSLTIKWEAPSGFVVPIPADEPQRLADLRSYHILDTPPEEELDNITRLAALICDAPIAIISLVDSERQWFKSKVGVDICGTSREQAFCAHAIMQEDLFIVPDATLDKRFAQNPLVTTAPKIRFYAGAPLVSPDHHVLGTLCVIDRVPRELSAQQADALRALARQVMAHLVLRRQLIETRERLLLQERDAKHTAKRGQSSAKLADLKADLLLKLADQARTTSHEIAELARQVLAAELPFRQRQATQKIQQQASLLLSNSQEAMEFSKVSVKH